MNKGNLINLAAEKANISKAAAEKAVNAIFEGITESLANKEAVAIPGFGSFKTVRRDERVGRNPRTMEDVVVPAHDAVVFKAAARLKDAVK